MIGARAKSERSRHERGVYESVPRAWVSVGEDEGVGGGVGEGDERARAATASASGGRTRALAPPLERDAVGRGRKVRRPWSMPKRAARRMCQRMRGNAI